MSVEAIDSQRSTGKLDRSIVVALAGDLIDAEGLNALTLKRVAQLARVTQPALYRHISSIDDLWRELGLQTRRDLATAMSEETIGRSGADAVSAVAHAWRSYGHRHPGRYRSSERVPVRGDDELEAAVARVIEVFELSMRAYHFPAEELRHQVLLLRSALHGFVLFELGDSNPHTTSAHDSFGRLVDVLCRNLETAVREHDADSSVNGDGHG